MDSNLPGCETRTFSPGRSPSMCTNGCHSPCVQHNPCGWQLHCGVYRPTATMRTRTTGIVSPRHVRYHTSPLVMLGIGVRASCHSRAGTILVYCGSMKSTVCKAPLHRQRVWFPWPSTLMSEAVCRGTPIAVAYLLLLAPIPSLYVGVVPSSGLCV